MVRPFCVFFCVFVFVQLGLCQLSEPCTTNLADGNLDLGSCISLYSCPPLLSVLEESGPTPDVTKMLQQAHCGFEKDMPMVCCPAQGLSSLLPSIATTTLAQSRTAAPKTTGGVFVTLPEPPVCGTTNVTARRVVGGGNAKLGVFPWMALIGYKDKDSCCSYKGGGTLVSTRHVLTAAHCVHKYEKKIYLVRLGELDLARDDDGATPMDVLIKQTIKHEEYNPETSTNDIALLVLNEEVTFTELIKPICLPRSQALRSKTFEGYHPIIAGWGDTQYRGPAATHLLYLQLPVVSNDFCAEAYKNDKDRKTPATIDERVICAGYKEGGKDACQGDSGGPLMLSIPTTIYTGLSKMEVSIAPRYQIGIISYGKNCAEPGFPGVYSRVTYYAPWLVEKITGTKDSRR